MKEKIKNIWGLTYLTIECNLMKILLLIFIIFITVSFIRLSQIIETEEEVYKYYLNTLEN